MIEQFSKEESVQVPDDISSSYSYDDILHTKFKIVNPSDCYQYDKQYNVYRDKTDDTSYMKKVLDKSEDLTIVGIVQPSEDATATMMSSGIYYPASLTDHVIKEAQSSEIVKKQLDQPDVDVFTGKKFDDKESSQLDMNSLFTVDTDKMKEAFTIDQSKLGAGAGSLDLSGIQIDTSSMPSIDTDALFEGMDLELDEDQVTKLSDQLTSGFESYLQKNNLTDEENMDTYFMAYLQTDEAQSYIQNGMSGIIQSSGLADQFQQNLEKQMQSAMQQYAQTISRSLQQQISSAMQQQMSSLANNFQDAIQIDASKFQEAIQMNMNEQELSELMMSLMTSDTATYENNLQQLGYADFDEPSGINIYPKDFENKEKVIEILDDYNARMEKTDEDKVISYTDYVGTLMSSVTDIINVISYVLIAFVAISLVVSSIMIGVITYISVLERKKEIGILRAIGASKHNISQVFNAETFIIGLLAGVLGIVITLILLIPGNMLIHNIAGTTDVNAQLPVTGAAILIALSVILTLIGGLIPSRKAAKSDPVTALRSE